MIKINSVSTQVQPAPGEWTYEDYLALPDDGNRYEIIEGVLYMTNAPGLEHQFTVVQLVKKLSIFVDENKLGLVLTAPFEVHLSKKSRPVQPDVLFIKTESLPPPATKFFEGAPDLIVEVLFSTSVRTDQHIKFSAYEQAGVSEYWIANPKTRSIKVFTLSGGEYALVGQFVGDELIESKLLPGLSIVANTLFSR
jgi:Uma2 family endonuclease